MRVITLASPSSLPRARVLASSLSRHQPSWSHEVLLIGSENAADALAASVDDAMQLGSVCTQLDLDLEVLLALHGEDELSALLIPSLLRRYVERTSEPVLHLPSSAWVLSDLQPVESALSTRDVMLVPRMTVDVPNDGLEPTQAQMERVGRVDETIMGVNPGGEAFLDWWDEYLQQSLGSLDGRESGARPEDRSWLARFLELAPARFSTAVLGDPGCNLNMWNLHRRTLEAGPDGVIVDGAWPLRFLNLPDFEPDRPHRLSPRASRVRVSRIPALHELCEWYASELRDGGWRDPQHRDEVGSPLHDGLVYDESLRVIYGSAVALGERFDGLFDRDGSSAFIRWLEAPAPRGGSHGINRYVFHRVARERPDVVRTYPDLDGADGPRYVAWCWAFGREELGIPDRFMPPSPGRQSVPLSKAKVSTDPKGAISRPRKKASNGPAADGLAVRLTGYLGHTLGLGAAARGYARALGAAGVPVSTVTVPLHHLALPVKLDPEYARHGFEDLVHEGAHGFEIIAVNADELPAFVSRLGSEYFEGPRIGIWGWETNSIPPRWQKAFELVDEIWVYSRFMAANIGAVAPVPVVPLPPPVEIPVGSVEPQRLGVPDGFLFLFVFDYLSTIQRKNPVGLIEAFKLAFAPGEGPQLLIKTINAPLRPLAEEEVLWAAHGRSDIHVIDRSLSPDELAGVMAACDCYASLHRAEGFGLTMAEAMAMGKPVIGTRYSGNVDFMSDENSYLVDYTIGRVGGECEIYPPDGEWADPSIEHAAQLMRRVLDSPDEARARGARAKEEIALLLSPSATGETMRRRLEELAGVTREQAEQLVTSP
jgi:glycosyltransferase involved in cell wall biosynthesis